MEKSASIALKKYGIKGLIRYGLQKGCGLANYDERIDTLSFFLNHYCDISVFPKAEGDLGYIQRGDTLLLAITDFVCQKYGLDYWLDAGTCLGAVRHRGFIPWDDDTDICMMRETYERAIPILRKELGKYGIDAKEESNEPIARIGIGYQHKKTGLWIDLLPAEYTTINLNDEAAVFDYHIRCIKYQAKWRKMKNKLDREQMFEYRKRFIPEICEKKDAQSVIYCPEFGIKPRIWKVTDILPTNKITFEEFELPVPNNLDNYLVQFYGDNYMQFPQTGICHHGGDCGKLTDWASQNGIDMNSIITDLKSILNQIQKSS